MSAEHSGGQVDAPDLAEATGYRDTVTGDLVDAQPAEIGLPILDRDACRSCGREIVEVDLYGTPFFTHKPRRDCLTWWHVAQRWNLTHQAAPMLTARRAPRVISPAPTQEAGQ